MSMSIGIVSPFCGMKSGGGGGGMPPWPPFSTAYAMAVDDADVTVPLLPKN